MPSSSSSMLILSAITYGAVLLLSSPQHMLRGVSAQGVPTDLTPECSTLLCDTMKQVTTCPIFGISWTPVCADYLMGYLFQCPGYPAKENIYDAPSICLQEYVSVVAKMKNGQKPIDVQDILAGNYSEYCYEKCYQDFVDAAYAFRKYPCPLGNFSLLSVPLNAFRGIACGSTNGTQETEQNCYDSLMNLMPAPSPTPSPTPVYNPLTDYTCGVIPQPGYVGQICPKFTKSECCLGNQATMLSQTFQSPFPPCMMKNCYIQSKAINEFCGSNINFATGTVHAWIDIVANPPVLPNMYNKTIVNAFQLNLIKFFKGSVNPTQVTFFDFTYYTAAGTKIPVNNATIYKNAARGNFSFTITLVDTTPTALQTVAAGLSSPQYAGAVASFYGLTPDTTKSGTTKASFFEADPIVVADVSSAPSTYAMTWALSVIFVISMYFHFI